jgi:gamma-glutamyltranspeptidase/glutathione hydrolase
MSSTPSDGCYGAPLVPSLGFLVSARGGQSWLDPAHPAAVAGRKRPRLTPSPAIVTSEGKLVLAFSTSGTDAQPQVMAQAFLNLFQHALDPQQAVELPRFQTLSHPSSVYPHRAQPGRLELEPGFDPAVGAALTRLGHDVGAWGWDTETGTGVCAIVVDPDHGTLTGGADPRRDSYAIGW